MTDYPVTKVMKARKYRSVVNGENIIMDKAAQVQASTVSRAQLSSLDAISTTATRMGSVSLTGGRALSLPVTPRPWPRSCGTRSRTRLSKSRGAGNSRIGPTRPATPTLYGSGLPTRST